MIYRRRAEILELAAVELDALGAHHLLQEQTAGVVADGQPVGLGLLEHVVGVNDSAGAGHIVDNHAGIAGNILAEMARDRSRISVVTAAGRESDDQPNRLALVKTIVTGRGLDRIEKHSRENQQHKRQSYD